MIKRQKRKSSKLESLRQKTLLKKILNLVPRIIFLTIFSTILISIIAYARGYRIDLTKKSVTSTGIVSISCYPKAAKVYLNGALKGATDINLTLPTGKYKIDIKKDGYTSWNKEIMLYGELVETIDVLLFPINPSLTPLTNLGITKAIPIGQTDRLLIFSQKNSSEKDGIYVFDPSKKALSFLPPLKLIALKSILSPDVDFNNVKVNYSPDLKQVMISFPSPSYLLSLDEENKQLFDITNSSEALLSAWKEEQLQEVNKMLEAFPKEIVRVASESFKIISFSPDKTKLFYQAINDKNISPVIIPPIIAANQTAEQRKIEKDKLYVYNKKEDKNYQITNYLPQIEDNIENNIIWYNDSQHLVFNEGKQVSVIDYDNLNKQTIYSGPFNKDFLRVDSDGKLLILTNLNNQANLFPDLYAVGMN